tara:strand:- start:2181 stop:2330 length:150 start_codon:yes stop_codon:yes gene_type:complete
MGPLLRFFFDDRFDFIGWAVLPRRMSLAEVGFVLLAGYELVRLLLWARS